jgi:hypothetical protein
MDILASVPALETTEVKMRYGMLRVRGCVVLQPRDDAWGQPREMDGAWEGARVTIMHPRAFCYQ